MTPAIAIMSTKGQIVIPSQMRGGISKGAAFLIDRRGNDFLLKHADEKQKKRIEKWVDDIEFAYRTEMAYQQFDRGHFVEMTSEDFLKGIRKW